MLSKKFLFGTLVVLSVLGSIGCPPVQPETHVKNPHNKDDDNKNPEEDPILTLEYHKYLKEVVHLLESDSQFKELIEKASPEDIKTGKIAEKLQFVKHHVRTKLDELKRKEINRLRELIGRKAKLNNVHPSEIHTLLPQHIDHNNVETFEEKDLATLIKAASNDLEENDRIRRKEFKDHELEKELERQEELNKLNPETRKAEDENYKKHMEERKHHEKVNEPGSKDQLEEVWDEEDDLKGNKFDPKTFFNLHDSDSNGYLDEFEVEALFQKELDKIFNTTDPDYDPVEREEEMNRMREHVFTEMDKNSDKLISMDEFIQTTNEKEFEKNEEWKSIEDEPAFDDNEFKHYSQEHTSTPPLGHQVPHHNIPPQQEQQNQQPHH